MAHRWWDNLSDLGLLEQLTSVGVQPVVARNLVSRRDVFAARYRIRRELEGWRPR